MTDKYNNVMTDKQRDGMIDKCQDGMIDQMIAYQRPNDSIQTSTMTE